MLLPRLYVVVPSRRKVENKIMNNFSDTHVGVPKCHPIKFRLHRSEPVDHSKTSYNLLGVFSRTPFMLERLTPAASAWPPKLQ